MIANYVWGACVFKYIQMEVGYRFLFFTLFTKCSAGASVTLGVSGHCFELCITFCDWSTAPATALREHGRLPTKGCAAPSGAVWEWDWEVPAGGARLSTPTSRVQLSCSPFLSPAFSRCQADTGLYEVMCRCYLVVHFSDYWWFWASLW